MTVRTRRERGMGKTMADDVNETTQKHRAAIDRAEERVREILFDLEEQTGASIESVEIDTRNFAQLRTDIWLTMERRA